MIPSIEQLFERIKTPDETVQNHAIAELWMLLEQSISTKRNDETWRLVLQDDLFGMRLSTNEIKTVIDRTLTLAESKQFRRGAKLSLIGIVAKNADVDKADALLRFFQNLPELLPNKKRLVLWLLSEIIF